MFFAFCALIVALSVIARASRELYTSMYKLFHLALANCNVSDRFRSRSFARYHTLTAPGIRLRSFIDIIDSIVLIPLSL